MVKLQNISPTLSAQSLQRQHDPACDLGILQTIVCLGFGLNSENELSLMQDQQPGTDFHRTFVHRPLWTFLNGNWRHIYIQKLLTNPINILLFELYYFNVWHCNALAAYVCSRRTINNLMMMMTKSTKFWEIWLKTLDNIVYFSVTYSCCVFWLSVDPTSRRGVNILHEHI